MGNCCESLKEKEKKIIVQTKDGELDIKSETAIEEEKKEKEKHCSKKDEIEQSNLKGTENELVTPKLQKEFSIDFDDNTEIYGVYELSNERIAIKRNERTELEIYSLRTRKFINKISHEEPVKKFVELKNNDFVIYSLKKIYIYKLTNNNNYELYQTIDEYQQGTFKKKKKPMEDCGDGTTFREIYELNSIYELMNGNLISCNSYGIKIYKKNKEGKYELFFTKKIKIEVKNVIEIKSNIIILFCRETESVSYTFCYFLFYVYKYNIEKDELTELFIESFNDRHLSGAILYYSYLINHNLLFIRFGFQLIFYDINEEETFVFENQDDKLSIEQFYCNYDSNTFIVLKDNKYKIFSYKNNKLNDLGEFPIKYENYRDIVNLKDNNFIIYSEKEIILFKKLN